MQKKDSKLFHSMIAAGIVMTLALIGLMASCALRPGAGEAEAQTGTSAAVTTRDYYAAGTTAAESTAPAEPRTLTVVWDAAKVSSVLNGVLEEAGLPLQSSQVTLTAPDRIAVFGTIPRAILQSYADSHPALPRALTLVLALLPETVQVEGSAAVAYRAEDESVQVTVEAISASGVAFQTDWLPADLGERIASGVKSTLLSAGAALKGLEIRDNTLVMTCEVR